jgi:penicillin-binding protein 2
MHLLSRHKKGARRYREIAPDEIFLDSKNLPQFDTAQFEGRLERPIARASLVALGVVCALLLASFTLRAWKLQVVDGVAYTEESEENRLRHAIVFGSRGAITDRSGVALAWNGTSTEEFAARRYIGEPGFAHLLGYVRYPSRDEAGFFYREDFEGISGAEEAFNETLRGRNGRRIEEVDARGELISSSVYSRAEDGSDVALSTDAGLQALLYRTIAATAEEYGFSGGAGVVLDPTSGEVLALVSFPEFSLDALTNDRSTTTIERYRADPLSPFLARAIGGLYTPGSIVKPFLALGALRERLISPATEIVSTGSLTVPNPFNPERPSVFADWRAHGATDMRRAIAVSSNVYFYTIGGGFGAQRGLGTRGIERTLRLFGIGEQGGIELSGEALGIIPNPEWKAAHFEGEQWLLGDTYNTAIGQYGLQVTPLSMARAVAALANGGRLVTPTVRRARQSGAEALAARGESLNVEESDLAVVREGMREAVEYGTAHGLAIPGIRVAAKTGTAEIGSAKERVNSWVIGFAPAERPHIAFAVLMERGPAKNTIGGVFVMRQVLEWLRVERPEYLREIVE